MEDLFENKGQTPVQIIRKKISNGQETFDVLLDAGLKDVLKGDLFTFSDPRLYFRALDDAKKTGDNWIVRCKPATESGSDTAAG